MFSLHSISCVAILKVRDEEITRRNTMVNKILRVTATTGVLVTFTLVNSGTVGVSSLIVCLVASIVMNRG